MTIKIMVQTTAGELGVDGERCYDEDSIEHINFEDLNNRAISKPAMAKGGFIS